MFSQAAQALPQSEEFKARAIRTRLLIKYRAAQVMDVGQAKLVKHAPVRQLIGVEVSVQHFAIGYALLDVRPLLRLEGGKVDGFCLCVLHKKRY